ncbi:pteridine reductase [Legionella israelensis]|uniref:pteridine reductase n=1 Tax=Legionella israelensis TaxID=454 RepID=UPI00117F3D28|nr:pteridine reductase [Legionella israelensis]QDP71660.1 pteridine reductase [Legionella israelensis]
MNQTNTQEGKTALITGSAKRIGAEIARYLHQKGFKVIIHCHRSVQAAKTLVDELNQHRATSAFWVEEDLYAENAPARLIQNSLHQTGRLDVLVNNASIFIRTPLDSPDESIWDKTFTINVKAPLLLSLNARPYLKKNKGVIVNITDIHAKKPLKSYAVYCQSKAALVMQTKALAKEFAPDVRVNAVAPGAICWPEDENELSPEQKQRILVKTPLKRHGHPQYIAQAAFALIDNDFVSGQTLTVDGGRSIGWS